MIYCAIAFTGFATFFEHCFITASMRIVRMEPISGVCLLLLAMGYGANIVWQLAHHKVAA